MIESTTWQTRAPRSPITHHARKKDAERTFREFKASILDRQIEALSDAMSAMLVSDPRLSDFDRAALGDPGCDDVCTEPS